MNKLGARQEEAAMLIAKGYTNAGISRKMFISEKTVGNMVSSVYKKMGIKNNKNPRVMLTRKIYSIKD